MKVLAEQELQLGGAHVDLREGQLIVVGLDAAHVMRGGCVQSLHQHLQRITELKGRR